MIGQRLAHYWTTGTRGAGGVDVEYRARDTIYIATIYRLLAATLLAVIPALAIPAYRNGAVTRPDGARIAYYLRDGAGPTLVLVPGSWGDYRVYDRFVEALSPSFRIVIVELRGHGHSQPASLHPTMEGFAEDILSVTDALALSRFYIGGHSIGGMLAIEITGRRPQAVAGAIAMEGWTHYLAASEAFGQNANVKMPPEQEKLNQENRQRVRSRLSAAETEAFASVWRRWDGTPILQSTTKPVLEIWGDRHRPRPSREQLRIPMRPNIELTWMTGASHELLIQCPEQVAHAANAFIARVESSARTFPDARRMFDVPAFRLQNHEADLSRLPRLSSDRILIYRGVEGVTGFNMHPYVTWFAGRFWAMWSCNRIRDLQPGQYVRYSTSLDGSRWSESVMLTPSEEKENFRYFARGFWVRQGALIALAARDEAVRPLFGPSLELRGYRWDTNRFAPPIRIAADTINNFPPEPLATGGWLMARRDHGMRSSMLLGGLTSPSDWRTTNLPPAEDGVALDEPVLWTLGSGVLSAAFRDGSKSRRLYRSFSADNGESWTPPVRTDFPDATAKFNVLRLSSGLFAMVSNPNPSGVRIPLCLSLSRDGVVFRQMAILRDSPTIYRYAGKDTGYAGYHYPQLLERGGFLYVIHSENMEDIVLLRITISEVDRLAASMPGVQSSDHQR